MNRSLLLRTALTILGVVGMLPILLPGFFSTLPFATEAKAGLGYVVRETPGLPLPEGLHEGDVLALDRMSAEARSAALIANNLQRGLSYPIVVRRAGEVISLQAISVVNDSEAARTNRLTGYPLFLSILALALVTLWRGRDWTAWGLSAFSLGICGKVLVSSWPGGALTGLGCEIASRLIMWFLAVPGLYIAAETLVATGLSAMAKQRFRLLFVAVLAIVVCLSLAKTASVVLAGWTGWMPYALLWSIPGNLLLLLPFCVLLAGYRNSDAVQRLRVRWVLWSTGLLGLSVIGFALTSEFNVYTQAALVLVQGLSFLGYLYAVLRHRLVDVSFVVDRALAYGLTTSLVVGVFAVLENFIEQAAVGNDASFLLQAGATLVLALVLNRVHKRVESLVDRLFFRRQHRVTQALRRFARECAFIEQHERLLSLTVEQIAAAVEGSGVAIYERVEGRVDGRYGRLIERGAASFPAAVEVDDRAFVALRASLQPVDLDELGSSALGADGSAFPMALRGVLIGAIVCGARRGEQFAPDERAELAKLAQEVGIALYVLRARGHERFVAAVASGEMRDPRAQARELLPSLPTYRL